MEDSKSDAGEDEPVPMFEDLSEQAQTLNFGDFDSGMKILKVGHGLGLPEWQLQLLANYAAKSMGVPPPIFAKALNDLRHTHVQHG